VWVFNRGAHPLIEFDKAGNMLQAFDNDTIHVKSSHGVRVGPDGNLWLVDVEGHIVLKMTPSGRVLMVLCNRQGTPGNNDSEYAFNRPTGVAFDAGGDFYVSDGYVNSRVIKFTKDAEYLTRWGHKGTGDGEFNLVHDVCIDSRGRVYVADRSNSRVQIFDANGKFLGKWTDAGQPWGIYYVKSEDAIYMCDGLNNRVVKLNLEGQILGTLGSFGKVQGKFDFAHNISVDSEGSIYVVEIKNWRVQKFAKPPGRSSD
jgi:DNA-binding beta-propeller fold protein YncE